MNEEKKMKWFEGRIQFIAWLISMIVAILWPYFLVYKQVALNTYRIDKIEQDRAARWANQDASTKELTECMADVRGLLIGIQKDVDYLKTKK